MLGTCANIHSNNFVFYYRDGETLTHLLKACLGSGILAMPYAFKNGGILFGAVVTIFIGIICAHCAYILVSNESMLHKTM